MIMDGPLSPAPRCGSSGPRVVAMGNVPPRFPARAAPAAAGAVPWAASTTGWPSSPWLRAVGGLAEQAAEQIAAQPNRVFGGWPAGDA